MTRLFPALLALAAFPAAASAASPIEGTWANPKRSVTVRIAPCGPERWCGRVVNASAEARNAAARAGTPQLIGTDLMSGLEEVGPGAWQGGVFVPDHNIRARGRFRLVSPTHMEVQGCALGGLVCREQMWTRIAGVKAKGRKRPR